MKKRFTLILASMLLTLGAWAQVSLTFDRTGTTGESVTVSIKDANGTVIKGAEAQVTTAPNFRGTAGSITAAILCPDANANANPTITLTFTITGLPKNFSFNQVGITTHALSGSNAYQETGDKKNRYWNVAATVNENDFGSLADIEISQSQNVKDWEICGNAICLDNGNLTLVLTITKGTENLGCYFGLSEVTLSNAVSFGATGYSTLYTPIALNIPDGVTAYTGSLTGEWLTLNEVESTIPANTAVILQGTADTKYTFTYNTEEIKAIENNALTGSTETVATSSVEGTIYTLQSHKEYGVAFMQYTGTNLTGFKAYLNIITLDSSTESTQAIRIRKAGDEETTSIEPSTLNDQPSTVIYDLMGRKVTTMMKGGMYIVNGKKVVK